MSVTLNPITVGSVDWGNTVNDYWDQITDAFDGSRSIDALNVEIASAANIGLKIKAASSQTGDLLQLLDNSSNIKTHADENGQLFVQAASSEPADGVFQNSQWTLWLDETNDEFELKAKKSNGTTITQTVGSGSATHDYILIRDEKSAGTDGGTFTAGAWRTRDLNTEVTDTGGHASVNSGTGVITLAAGTYECYITCPAFSVERHKTRLVDTATPTPNIILLGSSAYSGDPVPSVIIGRFTLASQTDLVVQHQCTSTRATNGFGVQSGFSQVEIYTIVQLIKVA